MFKDISLFWKRISENIDFMLTIYIFNLRWTVFIMTDLVECQIL